VEPFLFAALFIEIAVLISIPLLYPPGSQPGQGVLRYLIFQTLGMPFILFTGWMLTGLEAGSADLAANVRAGVLLVTGFAFLLAVFPFYTWIPLLLQQVNPYAGGFVLFTLLTASLLFGLTFFDQYAWIRSTNALPGLLTIMGTVMIVTGGVWAMFQTHLGRIFGYAVIVETGFSLLAAAAGSQAGFSSFALLFVPRLASMALWALALAVLFQQTASLEMSDLHGLGRRARLLFASILAAQLSLAGLPLLSGFPVKLNLLAWSAGQAPLVSAWVLAGLFGSIVAGLRTAYQFLAAAENPPEISLSHWQTSLLAAGILIVFLIGLLPQVLLDPFRGILTAFPNLPGM